MSAEGARPGSGDRTPNGDADRSERDRADGEARALLIRGRKRRRMIIISALLVVAAILIARPVLAELDLTPSQKLIVTSDDLGPGWSGDSVSQVTTRAAGATDAATIGMWNSELRLDCYATLTAFSTLEHANESYQRTLDGYTGDEARHEGPVSVEAGDRSVFIDYQSEDGKIRNAVLAMQKGRFIATIALVTHDGPGIDTALIVELAKVQAARLP